MRYLGSRVRCFMIIWGSMLQARSDLFLGMSQWAWNQTGHDVSRVDKVTLKKEVILNTVTPRSTTLR